MNENYHFRGCGSLQRHRCGNSKIEYWQHVNELLNSRFTFLTLTRAAEQDIDFAKRIDGFGDSSLALAYVAAIPK